MKIRERNQGGDFFLRRRNIQFICLLSYRFFLLNTITNNSLLSAIKAQIVFGYNYNKSVTINILVKSVIPTPSQHPRMQEFHIKNCLNKKIKSTIYVFTYSKNWSTKPHLKSVLPLSQHDQYLNSLSFRWENVFSSKSNNELFYIKLHWSAKKFK